MPEATRLPLDKKTNMTTVHSEERTYVMDPASGRCFATKDLKVELDPKTFKPL